MLARPMQANLARRALLLGAGSVCLLPWSAVGAADKLTIGSARGSIDFAIGDSKVFRTTGEFKDWQGFLSVDDQDVPKSAVQVVIRTKSVQMLDSQQTAMMKDADFFDVDRFPEMTFQSTTVERTGDTTLKVMGNVTLRGITRPMVLAVSVTDRKPNAPVGARYARFRAEGAIKRSEFGMTKFIEVVGDTVDITIRADAWR
jgi:polyisoprenoid-binding protein YceI